MRIILIICLFFILPIGHAKGDKSGFLIEPFAGYEEAVILEVDDGKGLTYGGRVGYIKSNFLFAADYFVANTDYVFREDPTVASDIDTIDMGITLGYYLPGSILFYMGYILKADATIIDNAFVLGQTLGGKSGYKAGLSYAGFPIAISLEYKLIEWNELDGVVFSTIVGKSKIFAIYLSFPMTFGK